jgi:hypothetical protein
MPLATLDSRDVARLDGTHATARGRVAGFKYCMVCYVERTADAVWLKLGRLGPSTPVIARTDLDLEGC